MHHCSCHCRFCLFSFCCCLRFRLLPCPPRASSFEERDVTSCLFFVIKYNFFQLSTCFFQQIWILFTAQDFISKFLKFAKIPEKKLDYLRQPPTGCYWVCLIYFSSMKHRHDDLVHLFQYSIRLSAIWVTQGFEVKFELASIVKDDVLTIWISAKPGLVY